MESQHSKYIIVGAGLSGLVTAYQLYQAGETDFVILEARDRLGGRILTHEHIDMGATWFQTHHQQVIQLLDQLGIEKYHQYNTGKSVLVYSTMAPAHYFEGDPSVPSAFRIAGGSKAMIESLAASFQDAIHLEQLVEEISKQDNHLVVKTNQGVFSGDQVVITIPPRITPRIQFSPELPSELTEAMLRTHTWMSNAMKIGMRFERPFWRDKNLSGTVVGQVGAVIELYDHTDYANAHFALMGFINEGLRDVSAEERQFRILTYLSKYLGKEVLDYTHYEEKDWSQDQHTASETIKSIYMSPSYGHPLFEKTYLDGKLIFSGAETSPVYGGYMDGAIYTGLRAAKQMMNSSS